MAEIVEDKPLPPLTEEQKIAWQKQNALTLEERRLQYACKDNFYTLDDVLPWNLYVEMGKKLGWKLDQRQELTRAAAVLGIPTPSLDLTLNSRVSVWRGPLVQLEVDAIVNAANNRCLGGGGVDGAIHRAAGPALYDECVHLNGCETGQARITAGYDLPARHVIHTVGPVGEKPSLLRSAYRTCLRTLIHHRLRTIGFCCVSTGVYGYPLEPATIVALRTVREWLEEGSNREEVDRIVFVAYSVREEEIYRTWMQYFFPFE